jgi:iron complex outermembrane receptor protein
MPFSSLVLAPAALAQPQTAASAAATPAAAVTTDQTTTSQGTNVLQEVVVTAEKRTEDVQKTPIVVNTATAEQLERSGALQLTDIEKTIPDVIIAPQGAATTMMIRGVYSTDTSPGSENADSINLDGAYLAKTQGIGSLLYDISRLEVAEGPQGTLYGRNANGGAINIITNKAALGQDSATATLEAGSYELIHADGAINMSLGDAFALRGAFHDLSHQGYFDGGQDDADEKAARVGFMWKPNEREALWGTIDGSTIGGNGQTSNVVSATGPLGKYVYVPVNPWNNSYYAQVSDPYSQDNGGPAGVQQPDNRNDVSKLDQQEDGATLENDYDLGPATWTTEAAWRKFNGYAWDLTTLDSYYNTATGYGSPARNYNPQHFDSQSIETRLASNSTMPLQWVAGLYGFHDEDGGTMIGYGNLTTEVPQIQIANGPDNGTGIGENAFSYAFFGQLTWTPVQKLHLTAGGRWTHDAKADKGIFTQFGLATMPPFYTAVPTQSADWSKFTYKLGVAYDVAPASMVYGSVATGYEAGGFGYGPGVNPAVGPVYAPETITAYEIGSKNRFAGNRLQVNAAAWLYKYKDYQANLTLFAPGSPLPVLTVSSAGQATYKGASLDFEYAMSSADQLTLNLSILNARYGSYVAPAPAGYSTVPGTLGIPLVETGQPITNVPAAVGNLAYDHIFTLSSGASFDWQLSGNYKGDTLLALTNETGYGYVRFYQPSFAIENTSLRYSASNGKWSITAYCHNIGNEIKAQGGAIAGAVGPAGVTGGYYTSAFFYDPRIIGVILQANIR